MSLASPRCCRAFTFACRKFGWDMPSGAPGGEATILGDMSIGAHVGPALSSFARSTSAASTSLPYTSATTRTPTLLMCGQSTSARMWLSSTINEPTPRSHTTSHVLSFIISTEYLTGSSTAKGGPHLRTRLVPVISASMGPSHCNAYVSGRSPSNTATQHAVSPRLARSGFSSARSMWSQGVLPSSSTRPCSIAPLGATATRGPPGAWCSATLGSRATQKSADAGHDTSPHASAASSLRRAETSLAARSACWKRSASSGIVVPSAAGERGSTLHPSSRSTTSSSPRRTALAIADTLLWLPAVLGSALPPRSSSTTRALPPSTA
mmetsp:Transcript_10208/g.29956  ORF Transcript_10208/g.29956 Transcript_10208/m.29956 type:complete len:323 (-) Transcript_10208:95-1063(-)